MARSGNQTMPGEINMIGTGTVVEGTLRTDGDIRISGHIDGTLQVDGKAVIAEEGRVEGKLVASSADVAGRIEGDIHVSGRLLLTGTAHVDGTVQTERLVIEEGAVFSGECEMDAALQRKQAQQVQASDRKTGRNGRASVPEQSRVAVFNGRKEAREEAEA